MMKRRIKAVINVVGIATMLLLSNTVMAQENVEVKSEDSEESSTEILEDFLALAFDDSANFQVVNEYGDDVRNEYLQNIYEAYLNERFEAVQELIMEEKISLSFVEESIDIQPRSRFETINFTEYEYELATDTNGRFTKEWLVSIYGSYVEDSQTGEIISGKFENVKYTSSFGAAFTTYQTNVNNEVVILNNGMSIRFTHTYKMWASWGISIGNVPTNIQCDFGTNTYNYTKY